MFLVKILLKLVVAHNISHRHRLIVNTLSDKVNNMFQISLIFELENQNFTYPIFC